MLQLDPDAILAEALRLRRAGYLTDAIAAARRLTEVAPWRLEAWFIWGTSALAAGRLSEAEQVLGEGARRSPVNARARFLVPRARTLTALGRSAEAVANTRAAVPQITQAADFNTLSAVMSQANLLDEALPLSEAAVALDPLASDAWHNLGSLYQFMGRLEDAATAFERAISVESNAAAHLALARLRKWSVTDNHIERLKSAPLVSPLDEARLNYALFKELDDVGHHDEAWERLRRGAEVAKVAIGGWDAEQEAETLAAWMTAFPNAASLKRGDGLSRIEGMRPRRLFIVGLPRSGTTLVERVLAAHSEVQALGELQTFGLAVKRVSQSRTPYLLDADTVRRVSEADPSEIAACYDPETDYLWDGRSSVTIDKLPHNHDYCGLIRRAFPDALIVHVRREPLDALFGAYRLLFAHAHKWSYDFEDLATHYDHYRRLMAHWQAVDPAIIDVSLEGLIANPESEIRRLLSDCGLPFEPACLSPHEVMGAVATASSTQVRKPINAEGIGAWRRYAKGLKPLHNQLTALGYISPSP
ncbi:tetratricopeptide repeat-containing sulfotransferase family protein [Asticcacaulis excentricus]|uniref:tetratricopeptide repeat-containing sulfotransferase family protein n=1 Tax=Asticcacaulis excentricus TaxID=78587 RepID=UPI0002F2D325|nr:sulfotransferase [Asticcacaulis excentricus]